jgi:hypothetical protein
MQSAVTTQGRSLLLLVFSFSWVEELNERTNKRKGVKRISVTGGKDEDATSMRGVLVLFRTVVLFFYLFFSSFGFVRRTSTAGKPFGYSNTHADAKRKEIISLVLFVCGIERRERERKELGTFLPAYLSGVSPQSNLTCEKITRHGCHTLFCFVFFCICSQPVL